MAQQINLCISLVKTQRQRFTARSMLAALGVFLVLGGSLGGFFVWSVQSSADGYRQTLDAQGKEIVSLQEAIKRSRANAAPVDAGLVKQLQERRTALQQRELVLKAVQQGVFIAGQGHSDRLLLVARSIPSPVWVTLVNADSARFEVSGFTLEPSALNEWVSQLALSPLMHGLKLSTVTVESTLAATVKVPNQAQAAAASTMAKGVPMWSFNLVNLQPPVKGNTP